MNRHGSMDAMHDEEETKNLTEHADGDEEQKDPTKESEQKQSPTKSKGSNKKKDSVQENNNENNNKPKKDKKRVEPNFKTKYFPWIVCATSFIVQFFVLGFYKAFGPVYVKLLQPEPEGYGGTPLATCRCLSKSLI